jgi:hypothetical protein
VTFETLEVRTSASGGFPIAPGEVARALHLAAGVTAEEIGTLLPTARGRLSIEVAAVRAGRVPTPLLLTAGSGRVLLELRRADDPTPEPDGWLEIVADPPPSPGALARALSEASGGLCSNEDLGQSIPATGAILVSVPTRWWLAGRIPASINLEGRTVEVRARMRSDGDAP